jgi:hypothetical protein
VISDPFPESGGIAVDVRTKKSDGIRVVQLQQLCFRACKGGALPEGLPPTTAVSNGFFGLSEPVRRIGACGGDANARRCPLDRKVGLVLTD